MVAIKLILALFLGFSITILFYSFLKSLVHKPISFQSHFNQTSMVSLATHRGFGKMSHIPENTMLAFNASENKGFLAHELDVRISKDQVPVLFHGPLLQKNTDGRGRLEDLYIQDLEKLNWGQYCNKPAKVTTLEHYLRTRDEKIITNVEIKRDFFDFSEGLENACHDVIDKGDFSNRVFYSSFHLLTLLRLRALNTKIPIGVLVDTGPLAMVALFFKKLLVQPDSIHPPSEKVTRARVKRWKKKGYNVIVWHENSLTRIKQYLDWGVDVCIVDNMELAKQLKQN